MRCHHRPRFRGRNASRSARQRLPRSSMSYNCRYIARKHAGFQGLILASVEDFSPRMSPAGGARDPRIAAQLDVLITRITVGHQRSGVIRQHLVDAVAMPADGEVEHVDRQVRLR